MSDDGPSAPVRRRSPPGRAAAAVAGVAVLGLAAYFFHVGADRADKLGSAIGAVIALAALLVPLLLPARGHAVAENDTAREATEPGGTGRHGSSGTVAYPFSRIGGTESRAGVVAIVAIVLIGMVAGTVAFAIWTSSSKAGETPVPAPSASTPPSSSPPTPSTSARARTQVTTPPEYRGPGSGNGNRFVADDGPRRRQGTLSPPPERTPVPTAPATTTPPPPEYARVVCPTAEPTVYSCHGGMLLSGPAGGDEPRSAYMEEWRVRDSRSDLWRDTDGLAARNGADLAVVDAHSGLSERKCQRVTAWRERVSFRELAKGDQLCVRTGGNGRYAGIVVRGLPGAAELPVSLAGYTWK
ncbi:hypothetical protein [Jidongwangia harbinensis]|uniref:hypothetical protein n=1 Tax=Jidongwangia harbinensis TaxID=2878561 RepID=UPI001CD91811|nr:hypothetical protein [Jidongwangia harbinensis]MCA2211804.1 hypothetical protein [Jidongwangia harbinensis]